ncbi:ESF1 homolog isoform X2 [Echeneis naucrates]|uniref:ESF1 homolog isoform X2 n=1 Tax=Echeneis naucrates TaxID=173247 RepID=UPI0011137D51|nr:ESF1 homolog isoform X2 [Echeneis naucrates]
MSSEKMQESDERFGRVQKDPRFWEMPERERKIKIDKRFQSMFHDERFKVTYTVDKRGRPINHTSTDDLRRFYQLSESEEEEDGSGLDSEDSDSEPDLARGKGNIETSSDDEDDVDDILRKEEEEIQHDWGELCKDAPRSDEVSARLAVCNMDWDRIKARDLLALLSSFTPKGGAVLSVKIYPSEFGKERLKMEETQGPPELRALPDDSEDDTEEERVYREKKRDYQFKRLKYFYAVVECDSADTATKIYTECDGYEFESSCSVLDLRFIPDDVTFSEEPRDVATDANLAAYMPKLFTSSATSTSKVQLTWDETDHDRLTTLNRKFNKNELLEMDFNAYLASSSEEEEEDENGEEEEEPPEEEEEKKKKKKKKSEEQISKYRELLKGLKDKEKQLQEDKDMEMEITWVPGLKETTEQLVKKKLEGKEQLTPWEDFLQKKRDKKRQKKKSDRKQGVPQEDLSDDELPPDVDLSDPFFSEELSATDAQRKQKGKKKKKKQEGEEPTAEEEEELERQKAQMSLLMDDDDKHKHFNYDKIVEQQNLSKKKKKKLLKKGAEPVEDDDFQVDVKDTRFDAMFTSHLFNLDPSHPSYRKTKATQSILAEKHRRREEEQRLKDDALTARLAAPTQSEPAANEQDVTTGKKCENESGAPAGKKAMDPGLSLLVKSIKSKTEQFQARKKQKLV